MERRLKLILELVTGGFDRGVKGASNLWQRFTNSLQDLALRGARSLVNLASAVFFLREAISTVVNVARKLWDLFVGGAQSAAQLEARFIALTGSVAGAKEIMELARQRSLATGKSLEDTAAALDAMATSAKDASGNIDIGKLGELNAILERMAVLKPDVPISAIASAFNEFLQTGDVGGLEAILDLPLSLSKALKDIAADMGQSKETLGRGVTFIEAGAAGAAGVAGDRLKVLQDALSELAPGLDRAMDAMGDVSGLERLEKAARDFADTLGGPIFEAVNEVANNLADLYEQDPEKFREIATTIGESIANIIRQLGEFDPTELAEKLEAIGKSLEEVDWQTVGEQITKIAESFLAIASSLDEIGKRIETLGWVGREAVPALEAAGPREAGRAAMQAAGIPAPLAGLLAGGGGAIPVVGGISAGAREAGRAGGEALVGGEGIGEILKAAIAAGVQEGFKNSRVGFVVDVVSNSELFDARIRQAADGAVTDGLGMVAEEMEGGQ